MKIKDNFCAAKFDQVPTGTPMTETEIQMYQVVLTRGLIEEQQTANLINFCNNSNINEADRFALWKLIAKRLIDDGKSKESRL